MHSFIHSVHRKNTKWTKVCQLTLFYVKANKPEYVSRQMSCPMSGEASSSSEVLVSSLTFLCISCNSFCVSTETHSFKEDVTVGLDKIIQHHIEVTNITNCNLFTTVIHYMYTTEHI